MRKNVKQSKRKYTTPSANSETLRSVDNFTRYKRLKLGDCNCVVLPRSSGHRCTVICCEIAPVVEFFWVSSGNPSYHFAMLSLLC